MAQKERTTATNILETAGDALPEAHEGNRMFAQFLANGFKRPRRTARTYVKSSELAAIAKLRTWR